MADCVVDMQVSAYELLIACKNEVMQLWILPLKVVLAADLLQISIKFGSSAHDH